MAGYIKLHRKLLKWGWYSDPNTFRVFMHLLLIASYECNEFRGHKLKPGQAVIGRKRLAKELKMSEQSVRTALEHLKSTNEITIKTTNRFSIVTIENWAKYQCAEDDTDQQDNQQANQQLTNNQPTTNHTQEIKKVKKVRNIDIKNTIPPRVEWVQEYCEQRGNKINAEEFCDFYASKGWMVGKGKMKDWKASVRTWENRNKKQNNQSDDWMQRWSE